MLFGSVFAIGVVALTLSCASFDTRTSPGLDLTKEYEHIDSNLNYKNLATQDLDQVSDLIQVKLNEYAKSGNLQQLREAALIVFSRPDEDGMLEKVIASVRNPLEEEVQWQNTIEILARQSVETMQKAEGSQADQVTAGIVLENIIAEYKPAFIKQYHTGGFETDVVHFIADSGVSYSKAASKERGLYLMRSNLNPSQIAKKLISARDAYLSQEKK